jgi:hypothetical protein
VSSNLSESRAGYLPVVSDHRVLWVDVPQGLLFGTPLVLLPTQSPQRFTLQDPQVVSRYIKSVSAQLQKAQLLPRLLDLRLNLVINTTLRIPLKQLSKLNKHVTTSLHHIDPSSD